MGKTRKPAKDVAQVRSQHEVWIDQAELKSDDLDWLSQVRWLTLWNVTMPPGFLAELPLLEGLDIRGGSADDLSVLDGCVGVRVLVVNQIRGLSDLSALQPLTGLEYLQLYGLKQVTEAPSLAAHASLRRLEVGMMGGLPELNGLLDAPELDELELIKTINVSEADVARIQSHPTLAAFMWFAADVPLKKSAPVVDAIDLPPPQPLDPQSWYQRTGGLL